MNMNETASILIVDDNISLCKTMSFVLRRKGCDVAMAKDGLEAIERVKQRPFDMIFMDIKMPLMDGVETYQRIKEIRPEAVVMMMTAYAVEDLVAQALKEGAYRIIYKPLDIERVVVLIQQVRAANQGALVLIVDDDPHTCITLKDLLTKRGFNVETASTGEEAIAKAQKKTYGIIFIDVKLPTINGLETYLAIKESNPEAVAVMMTGCRQEMAELVEEAINNSAYTCLYKPFDIAEVLKLIDEILQTKQKAGQLGRIGGLVIG
jgi:two-component system response regulator HydG